MKDSVRILDNQAPMMVPNKAVYMAKDLERLRDYWKVPLSHIKDPADALFNKGSLAAQRYLTSLNRHAPEKLEDAARELWMRRWSRDEDINLADHFLQVSKVIGVSKPLADTVVAEIELQEVKDQLKKNTSEAMEHGDEKNQVFTTNLWLELQWTDAKLSWDPGKYGGIKRLHIPTDEIWTPDVVLYNHAAGHPEITIYTDAFVYFNGIVVWRPPAIYKSFCHIDVMWFPYDAQECKMKFGIWTYTGSYIDMRQLPEDQVVLKTDNEGKTTEFIEQGMDISYFYQSAEWDLLKLTSERHEEIYESCCGSEKYVDVTYTFSLRRKALFFTVNLIMPCFLISFLTTFIFYLSDHKITLAISMMVTLIVFFLVLIELIPPTSLVIPMFGRYLLTTMILVTLGIIISVVSVNFSFRSGTTETMPTWIRTVFLQVLPKILRMKMPLLEEAKQEEIQEGPREVRSPQKRSPLRTPRDALLLEGKVGKVVQRTDSIRSSGTRFPRFEPPPPIMRTLEEKPHCRNPYHESPAEKQIRYHKQIVMRVLQHVRYIADHFRVLEEEDKVSAEWTFVAMVMDRVFLVVFAILNILSAVILLQAPSLYDTSQPLVSPAPTKPLGQDTLGRYYQLYQ